MRRESSAPPASRRPPIAAVVLAAGEGRRMGRPKLLLPFRGKPILEWVLELVEGLPLKRRLIVLGAHATEILEALFSCSALPTDRHPSSVTRNGIPWEIVLNANWREGMGSSLRLAARHVKGGMLVFLGDMPLVPREAALEVLSQAGERPVAPVFQGRRGFPVYLPEELRPRILELSGDGGARGIIRGKCELVPSDNYGVVWDIDTQEDLVVARGGG